MKSSQGWTTKTPPKCGAFVVVGNGQKLMRPLNCKVRVGPKLVM
jgi:hypothetical protein